MAEYKKRLIYANDVEFALQAICDRESGVPLITAEWLSNVVRKAPTVDAVEVVHGRWIHTAIEDDNWGGTFHKWTCSNCDFSTGHNPNGTNYCLFCGAKMDGEG